MSQRNQLCVLSLILLLIAGQATAAKVHTDDVELGQLVERFQAELPSYSQMLDEAGRLETKAHGPKNPVPYSECRMHFGISEFSAEREASYYYMRVNYGNAFFDLTLNRCGASDSEPLFWQGEGTNLLGVPVALQSESRVKTETGEPFIDVASFSFTPDYRLVEAQLIWEPETAAKATEHPYFVATTDAKGALFSRIKSSPRSLSGGTNSVVSSDGSLRLLRIVQRRDGGVPGRTIETFQRLTPGTWRKFEQVGLLTLEAQGVYFVGTQPFTADSILNHIGHGGSFAAPMAYELLFRSTLETGEVCYAAWVSDGKTVTRLPRDVEAAERCIHGGSASRSSFSQIVTELRQMPKRPL